MSTPNCEFLVIDTETTGLHPVKHGLIQVAALALDQNLNIQDTYVQDIRPPVGYEISEEALAVNHFTPDRIAKGIDYQQFCSEFLDFTKKNCASIPTVIGQFFPFDFAVLEQVFTTAGLENDLNSTIMTNSFIDTKSLVLSLNLKAQLSGRELPFKVTSLSKPGGLKEKFGITGERFLAHDALGDVMATREVLLKLLDYLP